jgi:hypothetical protein
MKGHLSKAARQEVVLAVRERYREASGPDQQRILDEFVAVTGYHRKHAIRVLALNISGSQAQRQARPRLYDEAVREALILLWEASDRVCGKRLAALVPILIDSLERHGHLQLDLTVRFRLLSASPATIDRLLAPARAAVRGLIRRRKPAGPLLRRSIPIRTFGDWGNPKPGFLETDLVAHCGGNIGGSFVYSLVLTDIATGWTECIALVVRHATLVVDAVDMLAASLPFPILGIDVDNGSEFINEALLTFCQSKAIAFTRGRPHHKNDQAWIEQKNGAIVRKMIGYGRLEGIAAAKALTRLYAASRLFVNFFQPSFKLASKTRVGSRITKHYFPPATPCARLLASEAIPESVKEHLRAAALSLDPLKLLEEIRVMQDHLARLTSGEVLHVPPHRSADLDQFLKSLANAWQEGEVRPTHRPREQKERHWRTREDPFETVWPSILKWLEAAPESTAKALLEHLQATQVNAFPDKQLRTLQRRVKEWRRSESRRILFADDPSGRFGGFQEKSLDCQIPQESP